MGRSIAVWFVVLLFVLAGGAKLFALDQFQAHLESWTIVPRWLVAPLALLVPSLEVGLAGLWVIGARRRTAAWLLLGLAMVFAVASTIQYVWRPPPDCGCLGILAKYARLDAGLPKLIGINAFSVLILGVWLAPTRADQSAQARFNERDSKHPRSRPSAFTLIETVLVVGIIALLVVLLLPSLGKVRQGAQDAVSLSNMRQHAGVFSMYATDWDDYSPYPVHPDATLNVFRSAALTVEVEYFWATELWQVALADAYYDGNPFGEAFSHPADMRRGTWITYRMTSSYLAHPNYWVNRPDRDISLWGGVRVTQTRFPANKAWLVEFNPLHEVLIPVGLGAAGATRKGVGLGFVAFEDEAAGVREVIRLERRTGSAETGPFVLWYVETRLENDVAVLTEEWPL
ncbi:MAG: MauE/DoxX family redox-associated membrane protein, partial [Phycisphaerales bacterium JB058]